MEIINHPEAIEENNLSNKDVSMSFLEELMDRISPHINFYVMDIARRKNKGWRLVEINSGEMSGLSCVDADELYKNLQKVVEE